MLGAILVTPAFASDKTYYVDSVTGNDANNCTTVSTPCLTLAAARTLLLAQADPSSSTLKLSGTFVETMSFSATDVTAPDSLDGLRITATDPSSKPTITGAAESTVISLTNINHTEVDHLIVTGGSTGIEVTGSIFGLVTGASIHHNTVQNIITTSDWKACGVSVENTQNAQVKHNLIDGVTVALVDGSNYHYAEGIYSFGNFAITMRANTIRNVSATNTAATVATHYSYVYGIYHYGGDDIMLRNNTIDTIAATTTATVASPNQTNLTYGIYINDVLDLTIKRNTITNLSAGGDAAGLAGSITAGVTGIGVNKARIYQHKSNAVHHNTISNLSITGVARTTTSTIRGFDFDYLEHTTIHHNTITSLTADSTSSEAVASLQSIVYGMDGPVNSLDVTVRDNKLHGLQSQVDNVVGGSSSASLYGILATNNHTLIVRRNTLKADLDITINNHDQANFNDSSNLYGLDLANNTDVSVRANNIKGLQRNYTTAGADGYAYFQTFGIYGYELPEVDVRGNTVAHIQVAVVVNDATATSTMYNYGYGIYIGSSANANIHNNTVKESTFGITGSGDNHAVEQEYCLGVYSSVGSTVTNNIINNNTWITGSGNTGLQYIYGIIVELSPQVLLQGNAIHDLNSTVTGANSASYVYGYTIKNSADVTANSNVFRAVTSAADNAHYVYGFNLLIDTGNLHLFNNIVLGEAAYDTQDAVGIYQGSTSTSDMLAYHNTVSDWFYALELTGGSDTTLKDNILSATGVDSYAFALAYNTVDRVSLLSSYNLFYNSTASDNIIYDTDAAAAVAFNDWKNSGGSWGYDAHSRQGNPKLDNTGHLKIGSSALGHGTTNYQVGVESDAATQLHYDIDGDARTSPTDSKVDIGADEFTS